MSQATHKLHNKMAPKITTIGDYHDHKSAEPISLSLRERERGENWKIPDTNSPPFVTCAVCVFTYVYGVRHRERESFQRGGSCIQVVEWVGMERGTVGRRGEGRQRSTLLPGLAYVS